MRPARSTSFFREPRIWVATLATLTLAGIAGALFTGGRPRETATIEPSRPGARVESPDPDPGAARLAAPETIAKTDSIDRADVPGVSLYERVAARIEALARGLDPETHDAHAFLTQVRAMASELGLDAVPLLSERAEDSRAPVRERLAALELLRVLRAEHALALDVFPHAALGSCRVLLSNPEALTDLPAVVAARALAAWGDAIDHQALLDCAFGDVPGAVPPADALRALVYAPSPEVALALTHASTSASLGALTSFATESAWALDPAVKSQVVTSLRNLFTEPDTELELAARTVPALAAWDEHSAELLSEVALDVKSTEWTALVLPHVELDDEELEELVTRLEEGPRHGLELAERVARATVVAQEPMLRARVLDLLGVAAENESVQDRVRAAHALGVFQDARARKVLERLALQDPDAGVRAAAVVALASNSQGTGSLEILARVEAEDASPAVRRLAAHHTKR